MSTALEEQAYARHGVFRREETLTSRVLTGFELAINAVFAPR